MEKDIKDYREKELRAYVVGNILVILLGSGMLNNIMTPLTGALPWDVIKTLLSATILSMVVYIYVFIADSLVPAQWKDKLIWYFTGMPGGKIFTEIRDNNPDNRFLVKDAEEKYKEIYVSLAAETEKKKREKIQNSNWYRIYRSCEKYPQVYVAQRDFLLCRDMAVITILILLCYTILQWYLGGMCHCEIFVVLIIEFIVIWFIAGNKGRRFAYNVIATDIAKNKENT